MKYTDITIPLSEDAIKWIAGKLKCSEDEAHERLEALVKAECLDRMNWLTPVLEGDNLLLIHVDEVPSDEFDAYEGSITE